MERIAFSHVDRYPAQAFVPPAGLVFEGTVESRPVIDGDGRPLHLWMHVLQPQAVLRCAAPVQSQGLFVWKGEIEADGQRVPQDGAVLVEHLGTVHVTATHRGATLMHFFRPDGAPQRPRRAGGHVHVVGPQGIYASSGEPPMVMFADSTCPTCEIWLHRTPQPRNRRGGFHQHDADEIMFVVEGSALIGRHELPVGSAIAVDANTTYALNAGADGLTAMNFRTTEPNYRTVPRDGTAPMVCKDLDVIKERIRREAQPQGR